MNITPPKRYASQGDGRFRREDFRSLGENVVIEAGVLVFHPETIAIGHNVYIGHQTILKGYHVNALEIGDHTWIGPSCFLHSAGGIRIGQAVGIGPHVKIITSSHRDEDPDKPVLFHELRFGPVTIGDGADIGIGAVILPGVSIGRGAIIGAGAVVTRDIPPYGVALGVPARVVRTRGPLPQETPDPS